ncbi:MAG: complexin-2 [Oscillospiraceae bacterium]|nr:complexin-2 [Oscillospiraceae bacterium]
MSKQVQIDFELFLDLLDYFEQGGEYQGAEFLAADIRKQLDSKLDKLIARELFTKYKRSPTGAEREAARQAYLNHRGVLRSYRTDEEYHAPEPPEDWNG